MGLSSWYFHCCESNEKLKDPFLKVLGRVLMSFLPIGDTFQHRKYSCLIYLVLWCYAMFKFWPSVHNVANGQHRMPHIRNTMTCIDVIAALENSSIMCTSTWKVLIQTECNGILWKCLLQGHLKFLWNTVVHVTSFFRSANSYYTSQTPKYYKP